MISNNIDKKVLEVVYDLLKNLIVEIEEKLFYPKEKDNVIEIKMGKGEVPF